MAHVNVDQYITTAQTAARVQRLNQAVLDLEVLPVIGGSGSGKRAFLEWWWQGGCADTEFAGDYPINSHEILLVRARHPGSSASVVSDVLTGLEVALKELERANMNGELPQPLMNPRTLRTQGQLSSLMRHTIKPLMDKLNPQAIVMLEAHYLDTPALHDLIELYAPTRRTSLRRPERGLILCGNTETTEKVATPFRKVLKTTGFTRAALPDAMVYAPLADRTEFAQIITRLVRQNLQAVPAEDLPMKEIAARFSEWTDKEWLLIRTLAYIADRCLGKQRGDEPRQFTRNVLECIEQTWVKRTKGTR
ncbi:MAG: hypothetical protein HC884_03840 [Chloroflexaceae bacterium]|nr:hypothetical protein [Chloroflexaceae bacterium]